MGGYKINIPVFTAEQAAIKRGIDADEMLDCPSCNSQSGVFVMCIKSIRVIGFNLDGKRFNWIKWNRMKCIKCHYSWHDKYGVATSETH